MLQNEGELGKSLPTYIHQKTIVLLLLVILGSWCGGVASILVVWLAASQLMLAATSGGMTSADGDDLNSLG